MSSFSTWNVSVCRSLRPRSHVAADTQPRDSCSSVAMWQNLHRVRHWRKTWSALATAMAGAMLRAGRAGNKSSSRSSGATSSIARRAREGYSADITWSQELWRQFLGIAAPYFVPVEYSESTDSKAVDWFGSGFLPLVAALLIGVVSGTYWLALGLGTAVVTWGPESVLPEGVTSTVSSLTSTPWYPLAAGAGLSISSAAFYSAREKLDQRWGQWGMLGLLLFLLFCVTGLNVLLSYVFRSIDNLLVAKDAAAYYQELMVFGVALLIALPVISGYRFVRFRLGRLWREDLTKLFLEKYMSRRQYYLLDSNSQAKTNLDNPDQRISEDIDYFTRETLDFLLDMLDSILNLVSFSAILWTTSQQLTGALVVYAFAGTLLALYIGGRLININYEQLRLQADLRYSLVHIRDNAEAIAFYGGEERETREVSGKLDTALQNYDRLIIWKTGLSAYQKAFFYLARLVPLFVLGGLYFAGEVDFGTLGQAQFAFSMVLSSVALIVSRIQDISRFSAGITRLGVLWEVLNSDPLGSGKRSGSLIATEEVADTASSKRGLSVQGMTLETPDGARVLVEGLTIALASGSKRRLLVVGSSGVGKSSVLRAIAGLWTRGNGTITRPASRSMLFLPQRPYMPLGDLRTQLLYPSDGTLDLDHTDADLQKVLAAFGLANLAERFPGGFDAIQDWARVLSLGEQQRLAAARCLVSHPRFVVLDEATSALPLPMERSVYERLQSEAAIEGYISVGHRPSLAKYHDCVLEVLGDGKWRILSTEEYLKMSQA